MIAVNIQNKSVSIQDVPLPVRPPGYALLRTLLAGICNTDLELQRGYYGFTGTPGHEFVAEVVEADDVSWIGKRVVGEINLACQRCDWCKRGLQRHCPNRTVLGIVRHPGAFAEYLTLPEENLFEVPDGVSTEDAVFIEPLAAACEILDQVDIDAGEPVAVLGDGKLGLLIAQVIASRSALVTHFGKHESKLSISKERGIATSTSRDAYAQRFRVVIEATGSSSGLEQAIAMTQPRGMVVLKSTVHDKVSFDLASVIVNEITLVGSRCGRFSPAIELLADKRIDVKPMLSCEFALADATPAFEKANESGILKVILRNDRR